MRIEEGANRERVVVALGPQPPLTAPCMRPGCSNVVTYRDARSGLFCSHRCRSVTSNTARRLERQLEILTDPALLPDEPAARAAWARREALVRWHLKRYRGKASG